MTVKKVEIDDKIDYRTFYDRYLERVVKAGDRITAKCPICNGRSTTAFSADLKTGLWRCHKCDEKGNIYTFLVKAQSMTEDDARETVRKAAGIVDMTSRNPKAKKATITLAQYADEKKLPLELLNDLDIKEKRDKTELFIPYMDEAGIAVVKRRRLPKGADQRFKWVTGSAGRIIPYGVWKLRELAGKPLHFFEGESDCHALWHRGFHSAIGIPGATMMKPEWVKAYFADAPEVYLHIEPGEGGQKFLAKCAGSFAAANYSGKVKTFATRGAKDPSELHVTELGKGDGDDFDTKWKLSIDAAQEINPAEFAAIRDDVTTLPGAPVSLRVPEGFLVTQQGIKLMVESKGDVSEIQVSPVPILLSRRLRSIDTGEEKIELAFQRDGIWHSVSADRPTVFATRNIVELSRRGLPITSEKAKHVVRYLGALEDANLDTLPLQRSVERMGWVGARSFLPQLAPDVHLDPPEGSAHLADAYHEEGTIEQWREAVSDVRDSQPFARFMLAASLGATLLRDLRQRVFIVHLWGQSRGGKTAAMKLALSAWGNPDTLMATFNTTAVGMERMAGFYNDLPLGVDERQVVSGKGGQGMIEGLVYMLGAGKGRVRGAQRGGLQQTNEWRTIALTTGEEPLSQSASHTGIKTRALEIYGTPIDDEELAGKIHRECDRAYGHAGPEFVRNLIAYKDGGGSPERDFEQMVEQVSKLVGDRMASHVNAVALIALADLYASQWLFALDSDAAATDALDMARIVLSALESASEADYTGRADEWLEQWIATNREKFSSESNDPYGFERDGLIYISPSVLEPEMLKSGFVYRRVMRDLVGRERILPYVEPSTGKRRLTQKVTWLRTDSALRVQMLVYKPSRDVEAQTELEGEWDKGDSSDKSGTADAPWWNRD